jgi:hypothetical protein
MRSSNRQMLPGWAVQARRELRENLGLGQYRAEPLFSPKNLICAIIE